MIIVVVVTGTLTVIDLLDIFFLIWKAFEPVFHQVYIFIQYLHSFLNL